MGYAASVSGSSIGDGHLTLFIALDGRPLSTRVKPPKPLRQRINQLSHRGALTASAGVSHLHVARGRGPVRQHDAQAAIGQRRIQHQSRENSATHAVQRRLQQHAHVVDHEARRVHVFHAAVDVMQALGARFGGVAERSVGNRAKSSGDVIGPVASSSPGAAARTCSLGARRRTTSSCGSAASGSRTRTTKSTPSYHPSTSRLAA